MAEHEEVRDPEGLLKAYREAVEDLKTTRDRIAAIEAERDQFKSQIDSFEPDAWKPKAVTAEVKLALARQGIKDVDRLVPYIGTDGIDVDENGKLTGLDERMNALRKDLPEVFDPKVRAGGKADAFAASTVEPKVNPMQQAIHKALNG